MSTRKKVLEELIANADVSDFKKVEEMLRELNNIEMKEECQKVKKITKRRCEYMPKEPIMVPISIPKFNNNQNRY